MSDPTPSFPVLAEPLPGTPPQPVWIIRARRTRWWIYVLFFLLTLLSTTLFGAHMQFNFAHRLPAFAMEDDLWLFLKTIIQRPSGLLLGLPFSLTLMFILMAHEMGHYLCARHYRVFATPPFFIPFPSLFGTLGAFIRIKSPIPSSGALFDIGIAGPIAGFIPACGAVIFGLWLSQPLASGASVTSTQFGFLPLIFHVAARILGIQMPLGSLSLHPIAAAGWVGMFATAMNLLPGGQLDGGHILYSVLPKLHRWISLLTVCALILLTKYCWAGWLLWSVVLYLTSQHPTLPNRKPLSQSRKLIAVSALVMLTLAFTPEPLAGGSGREAWPDIRDGARDTMHSLASGAQRLLHRK